MIQIRHLHYVVTTADLGSFSAAARSLRVKQATLSQRVRHLELGLGIDLFERSTRGARLTSAGAHFLTGARRIIADLDDINRKVLAYRQGCLGVLSIGLSGAVPMGHAQALLLNLCLNHQEILLTVSHCEGEALASGLCRGQFDAIIFAGENLPPGASPHACQRTAFCCDERRKYSVWPG